MREYLELTKPRITWLILMSTAVGYYFGRAGGWQGWILWRTLLGTALMASGTAVLNQWWERDADGRMGRTRGRPIPSGRIGPGRALAFGAALSAGGFVELLAGVNPAAALCGLATLAVYLGVYTPLKSRTPHATTVGALAGATPPLIGFAGATGGLSLEAWALFAILFLWQFPHFLAIAWIYREDYARGGMRMLPVVDPEGSRTARQVVLCSLLLVAASLWPARLGMTAGAYWAGCLALGSVMLWAALRAARERTARRARGLLRASVFYLPALYGLMLAASR